jgi:hypothetical protein
MTQAERWDQMDCDEPGDISSWDKMGYQKEHTSSLDGPNRVGPCEVVKKSQSKAVTKLVTILCWMNFTTMNSATVHA